MGILTSPNNPTINANGNQTPYVKTPYGDLTGMVNDNMVNFQYTPPAITAPTTQPVATAQPTVQPVTTDLQPHTGDIKPIIGGMQPTVQPTIPPSNNNANKTTGILAPSDQIKTNTPVQPTTSNTASTVQPVTGTSYETTKVDAEKYIKDLVAQGYTPTMAAAAAAQAFGYDASKYSINKATDTVQGQIADITSKNNELNTLARTQGLQEAESRGLLNSSLGVEAAQNALYKNALPIATADANAYLQTGLTNTAAENTARQFTAGAKNAADIANAQMQTQVNVANANNDNQAKAYLAQAQNNLQTFKAQLGVDVDKYNADQLTAAAKYAADTGYDASKYNVTTLLQAQQFDQSLNADIYKTNLSADTQKQIANLDASTKAQLAGIEADYKTTMQTSASASQIYSTFLQEVGKINANKDMAGPAKQTAIQNLINGLKDSLAILSKTSNINVSDLLTFETPNLGNAGEGGSTGGTGGAGSGTGGGTGGGTPTVTGDGSKPRDIAVGSYASLYDYKALGIPDAAHTAQGQRVTAADGGTYVAESTSGGILGSQNTYRWKRIA